MRKRIICFYSILLLLLCIVNIPVYAYKPSPFLRVDVNRSEIPQGTSYIDLLVPVQADDQAYVPQKEESESLIDISDHSVIKIENTSEIANYDEAYYSYLFHFKDSTISVYTDEYSDTVSVYYGENQDLLDYLAKRGKCKLAFVDAQGNIRNLSNDFQVKNRMFKDFTKLEISNNEVLTVYTVNAYRIVFACIAALALTAVCIVVILLIRQKSKPLL